MKRNRAWDRGWAGAAAAAASLACVAIWQLQRLFTEEPRYDIERRFGPLEVRRYVKTVRAETTVDVSDWREALEEGFQRLAGYVFGRNDAAARRRTARSPGAPSQRIRMTSPVCQTTNALGPWRMAFTMPSGRSLDSLPRPADQRVHLKDTPSRRVAVLRFSGRYTFDRIAQKSSQLRGLARAAGLTTRGEVEFAGYDPPTTLPFLRRNEVWVELDDALSIS